MATPRTKKKSAVINREKHEEHPWSSKARDMNVPRTQEDYITQVSEETEGGMAKKLSQDFSRTESPILGSLFPKFKKFFWTHKFGFTPDPFRGHPETQVEKTREQMRIVPRIILILKEGSL